MEFIAFVTKGLEKISADELSSIPDLKVKTIQDKFIKFEYDGDLNLLAKVRTIDDISLFNNNFNIKNDEILKNIDLENLKKNIEVVKNFRTVQNTFSITASIYKNENFKQDQLKQEASDFLKKPLGMSYSPMDHSNIDIRINIEEQSGFVTVKLFKESLYKRDGLLQHTFGSLRPSVAAAIVYKLKKSTDENLVDNLCGTGTILFEGAYRGLKVYGGDIDSYSVELTISNLRNQGVENYEVVTQDAIKTKWESQFFDIAISNFPWNKQVKERNLKDLYKNAIKEYARILKPKGTKVDLIKEVLAENFPRHKIEDITIGYLGQTPSIVFCTP
jgi:23S rRNA G2445 N2-methylase RlmL